MGDRPAGFVLCGGRSSRMGSDKSLLITDGEAWAVRAVRILRSAGASPVAALGGDEVALAALGVDVVRDEFAGEGPLGGVITALRSVPGHDALVVACDLPDLDASTVSLIVEAAARAGSATEFDVAMAKSDRLEPLCALWRQSALHPLAEAFGAGERSIVRCLHGLGVLEVAVTATALRNVNSPDELRARR